MLSKWSKLDVNMTYTHYIISYMDYNENLEMRQPPEVTNQGKTKNARSPKYTELNSGPATLSYNFPRCAKNISKGAIRRRVGQLWNQERMVAVSAMFPL